MDNFLLMDDETKKAVKKAFEIGKVIFGLGSKKYRRLLSATDMVHYPTNEELKAYFDEGLCLEDALITELKSRYKRAAVQAGFSEEHGIAMLEYAAMLEDLKQ